MRTKFITILLFAFIGISYCQNRNPNEEVKALGVSEDRIEFLCGVAVSGASSRWELPSMIEKNFSAERINYKKLVESGTPKEELQKQFADLWETKYSKIYCEISNSLYGSLDAIALYHQNEAWVYAIYDPNGDYKADINRISYLRFDLNKKGTLLDYLQRITSDEYATHTIQDKDVFKGTLEYFEKDLRERYGAKYMRELKE